MSIRSANSTNSLNAQWPIGSPVGNGAAVAALEQCMFPQPGADEIRPPVTDSSGSLLQRARPEACELAGRQVVDRVARAFQARGPTMATDVAVESTRPDDIHVSSPSRVAIEPDQYMQQALPLSAAQEAVQESALEEALQAIMATANRQGISEPQAQQHHKKEVSIGTADDAALPMEVDRHRSHSFDSEESTSQPHGGTVDDLGSAERATNALPSMQDSSTQSPLSIGEEAESPPADKTLWSDWILENVAMGQEFTLHEVGDLLGDTAHGYIGTIARILQGLCEQGHFQLNKRRDGGRLLAFYRRIGTNQQSGTGDVRQDDLSSSVRKRPRIMTIAAAQEPPIKRRRTQGSAKRAGASSVHVAPRDRRDSIHDRILSAVSDGNLRTAKAVDTLLREKEVCPVAKAICPTDWVRAVLNELCEGEAPLFERIRINRGYEKWAYRRLGLSPTIEAGNALQGDPSFGVERRHPLEPASLASGAMMLPRPLIQPHPLAAPVGAEVGSSGAMTGFWPALLMTGFAAQETPAQAQGSAAGAAPSSASVAEVRAWLLGDRILETVWDRALRTAEEVDALLREKGVGLEGEDGDRVARVQEALNALCRAEGTRDFECIKIGTDCLYRRLGLNPTIGAGNALQGGPSFGVERRHPLEPASLAPGAVTLPRSPISPHQPAAPVGAEVGSSGAMTGFRTAPLMTDFAAQETPAQAQGSAEGAEPSAVRVAEVRVWILCDRILRAVLDQKFRTAEEVDALLREKGVGLEGEDGDRVARIQEALNALCRAEGTHPPRFEHIKVGIGYPMLAYRRAQL